MDSIAPGIFQVETFYLRLEGFACCYIVKENNEAAIIETNTNYAVPRILSSMASAGVRAEDVRYVIVTHVHLDHAGGAGELLRFLPNAKLVIHEKGAPHLIRPEKLIASSKAVYGEKHYQELYGDIVPVPEDRVLPVADSLSLSIGGRELKLMDSPGHARHHLIIWDRLHQIVFSGDSFGIGYPRFDNGRDRLILPSTSPTQFDYDAYRATMNMIVGLEPRMIMLTHFGPVRDIAAARQQQLDWLDFSAEIVERWHQRGFGGDELLDHLKQELWHAYEVKLQSLRPGPLTDMDRRYLFYDVSLNAQGLVFAYERALGAKKPNA